MRTRTCLLCRDASPSASENHLCDECIEQGKHYAALKKKRRRRRKKKKRDFWLPFISLDQRIVDEVRFRFKKRFSHSDPRTDDEEDFIQHLFLSYVKARNRYNPRHTSAASLQTFFNRALDRNIKYFDRTRLTSSPEVRLYADQPGSVYEADWFFVATDMKHEYYRQQNGERKYSRKPPHFNLGLDMAFFAEEIWADASSLRLRTTETLQTLSEDQRSAFELLIAGHTQKEIANNLDKSKSWVKRRAKHIRIQFGLKPQKRKLKK